jgi:hypothetical protein
MMRVYTLPRLGDYPVNKTKTILNSAIVIYFIIGLEILIMTSPFA